ncbi:MAG: fused MFS/spermidine synthase [Elusimicrobiota bacterium]
MIRSSVLAVFFFSGFAGLVYEVVWLRMLVRAFGCTAYAAGNVLAVFMAGLAAGAWAGGLLARRLKDPLRGYAAVELLLAAAAAGASFAAARMPRLFAALAPDAAVAALSTVALRSTLAFAVLFVPALLMGASLPLLARRFAGSDKAGRWDATALLYGGNTLGAVAGVLFAGFYALGALGEWGALRVALSMNVLAALAAGALALASPLPQTAAAPPPLSPKKRIKAAAEDFAGAALRRRLPALVAALGFCSLALEVLWTRLLILLVGTSIYAFSAMLSCFLVGIALGSLAAGRWLAKRGDAAGAFGLLPCLGAALLPATLVFYMQQGVMRSDPSYLYSPLKSAADFAGLFFLSGVVIVPVTFVFGALFPLAAAVADPDGSAGGVGRVYAFNTAGAVAGSLAASFFLIPALGTRNAVLALAALELAVGFAALSLARRKEAALAALIPAAACAAAFLFLPDPFSRILQERIRHRGGGTVFFHEEGASSTVTAFAGARGDTPLLINGIIVSGKGDLGHLMAHLPLGVQERPRRALVICLGAGNTFRAAVDHGVAVDLVELEPEVIRSFRAMWPDHKSYFEHPGVRVFQNDGRNFLLTSKDRYDLIVLDGTPPIFSAGTVNLYAREFVELARAHLTPTGMLALWVPLPCFKNDVGVIARYFTDLFPFTFGWQQPDLPGFLLVGGRVEPDLDPARFGRRLAERGVPAKNSRMQPGLLAPQRLIADARIRALSANYAPVTDDRPRTEFPLPLFLKREPLIDNPLLLWP